MTDKPHIMVVEARFYEDLSDALWEGARAALETSGATYERVSVPGALEIPIAIRVAHLADPTKFDGYVALGCVIRGETTHYDTVCNESARGLMNLGIEHGLAIGNGILTCENDEQAWARAKANELDKGGGAALAALSLVTLRKKLGA